MIKNIYLRELCLMDEEKFLKAMTKSKAFHYPYIDAPSSSEAFREYYQKSLSESQKSYLAWTDDHQLIGVFNISGITYGVFQSAYLGYYATFDHQGKGLMSQALKLVLNEIFVNLKLHRIEANIQPTNNASIHLAIKNGFFKEGFSPRYLKIYGIWQDHFRFALTYEDWLANRRLG